MVIENDHVVERRRKRVLRRHAVVDRQHLHLGPTGDHHGFGGTSGTPAEHIPATVKIEEPVVFMTRIHVVGHHAVDRHPLDDEVLDRHIAKSGTPVVLSNSGCKAIYDHPRNVDDDRLRALAANGGVIQINSYGGYLRASKPNPERAAALKALFGNMHEGSQMTPAQYAAFLKQMQDVNAKYPDTDRPTFDDFMKHLLHALEVVGPDHVGIGMDWDGGGGVVGLEDASGLPKITAALLRAGYNRKDIAKIWGGNILRVMAQVEAATAVKTES